MYILLFFQLPTSAIDISDDAPCTSDLQQKAAALSESNTTIHSHSTDQLEQGHPSIPPGPEVRECFVCFVGDGKGVVAGIMNF